MAYDAMIGRFISPDTIIPNPANPQSFNRYSYCLNNPLKYTDPSGHEGVGHATNGTEVWIIDEQNGQYRLVGTDGTATGWYNNEAELKAAWGEHCEDYGGFNESWVDWQPGQPYTITVYDPELYDEGIKITFVPEGSFRANWFVGDANARSWFFGSYIRYKKDWYNDEVFGAFRLIQTIRHEWFHGYERQTQSNWDYNYQITKMLLSLLVENPYAINPDEVEAREYAWQDPWETDLSGFMKWLLGMKEK